MDIGPEEAKYTHLLHQLKLTVESLLGCHPSNKWDIYGGLQRLHVAVGDILEHGFRFLKENGKPDLWVFVQGLSWLQPTLAASPSFFGHSSSPIRSPVRNTDKAVTWLYNSIDSHTLSDKLSWLLSDHEHLLSCYNATAFLRQIQYSEATLICLRALEQSQVSLLAKIDPSLYFNRKITTKKHRRCLSYPEAETIDGKTWTVKKQVLQANEQPESQVLSIPKKDSKLSDDSPSRKIATSKVARVHDSLINSIFKSSACEKKAKQYIKQHLLKKSFSQSDVYLLCHKKTYAFPTAAEEVVPARRQSFSASSCAPSSQSSSQNDTPFLDLLTVRYNKPEAVSKEKRNLVQLTQRTDSTPKDSGSEDTVVREEKPLRKRRRSSFFKLPFRIWEDSDDEKSVCSDDSRTLVQTNACLETRKSFIENGGHIALPLCIGSFPKPSPGQSIMSFLTSGVFTQMNAELDRENAHFNISEAMIAAFEQVKFNQQLKQLDELIEESDEEINQLKRIIRIKRKQKQNVTYNMSANLNDNENTDNTATTDQSVNSLTSSVYSTSESISTDEDVERTTSLPTGLSVSKLSLFSDEMNDSELSVSAENVAISLLRKFKENQLPAASEIEWLVSERDAPQQILPLPSSIQVDDPSDRSDKLTLLRGTAEWAPPRPQIIFTAHPRPVRRQILEKQMYRCAGCGTAVAQKYASKFRYCEYLGRYFCSSCHHEQTAIIPGRVLSKWDLTKYSVSNFSYRLLDQMATDPLFNVMDLNGSLYRRVGGLQKIRLLRVSLFYFKNFIFTCKYTDTLQEMIREEPSHVYNDPDSYSIMDFIRVKNGNFYKTLSAIVKNCENHVNHCQLCQARGFICELCDKQETIFPWELNTVVRCGKCGSCHHIKCYQHKMVCPKCVRISNRNDLHKIGMVNTLAS